MTGRGGDNTFRQENYTTITQQDYVSDFRFTSDQHRNDAENLLGAGRGRHVSEPYAGQTGTREIQRSYVRLRMCHILHVDV